MFASMDAIRQLWLVGVWLAVIQSSPPRPWQLTLAKKLSQLHSECYEKRASLTKTIQEFPALQGVAALDEIADAVQIGWNVSLDIATERAREILQPGDPRFEGSRTTCPLSWSYTHESLWRGMSDNQKLIRLARSMITRGYRLDEPINCRTSDLSALDGVLAGKLLFGDGQARGQPHAWLSTS